MKKKKFTEKCGKCQSTDFAISEDIRQTRYCAKCQNVWLPKSVTEMELDDAKEEISKLQKRIDELESTRSVAPPKQKTNRKHKTSTTNSLTGEDLFG